MTALYDKYRPTKWEDVIGQDVAVKVLRDQLKRGTQQFLLIGPSGSGKTTCARIAAREAGCLGQNLVEVQAAKKTGVDDMRDVSDAAMYSPMGGSKKRGIILDECHRLSGNAWDSLLKVIEEPPKHLLWFLATTDPGKIPKTIKTRCSTVLFNDVEDDKIRELLCDVCDAEKLDTSDDIIDLIVKAANGSPRWALSKLGDVAGMKTKKEAAAALQTVANEDAVIELCRFLLKGGSWKAALGLLERTGVFDKDNPTNPEGIRIVVVNYIAAVLKKEANTERAKALLNILYHFSTPYNTSEKAAPLLLSVGNIVIP